MNKSLITHFTYTFSVWLTLLFSTPCSTAETLTINQQDYFEKQGLNVFVFSNWYDGFFSDSKISGVELVHHGDRTATNGDVRLTITPEQWDEIPQFVERKVNKEDQSIEAFLKYPQFQFEYSIKVKQRDNGFTLSVQLKNPLPKNLEGKAGFNLEFLPSAYFHQNFVMDNVTGGFPIYPIGLKEINNKVAPTQMAKGQRLVLAPGNLEHQVTINSKSVPLTLYDGRSKAQNGWFVVRSDIPSGKVGSVIEWNIDAVVQEKWVRKPMIAHSQIGYHPAQNKVAVIETDVNDAQTLDVKLIRFTPEGNRELMKQQHPKFWGKYLRYNYLQFDFSDIKQPGLYAIVYGAQETDSFRIDKDVLQNAWQPSLDTYMPVQMDHMLIQEAYRIWHGASHLDDALQAPVNHEHFDLYAQGPTTDTPYQPGQHIPGLNIGGWYDAGDYDIRTQTQYEVVNTLVEVWESFGIQRDNTTVDYARKHVELRVADGIPDVLQQIKHGTLALIAQHRAVGHAIPGIVEAHITQYTHLGDGITKTDNLIFDSKKSELDSDGVSSGKFDDRWAFTTRSSSLNFGSAAALAAASRALKNLDPQLANESLVTAKKVWDEEAAKAAPDIFEHGNTTGGKLETEKLKAAVELLISTRDKKYVKAIEDLMPSVTARFPFHATWLVRAIPYMPKNFTQQLRPFAVKYKDSMRETNAKNPFGVMITGGGWAGSGTVLHIAVTNYYLYQAFPDLFSREDVLQGLNFIFGTHPAHNLSLVSGVGTRSKEVAYCMNRADFSFIAGGIVPGILLLKPDLPENHEDWPFFWGQNEYVMNLPAAYIFLVNAADKLLK